MKEKTMIAAEEIGMFCRLQMHIKKGLPIRPSEMGALIYVQKQKESVTPMMISDFFQIAKPSVTTMINELVKKGYLEKIPSTKDKRSYMVSITKKGEDLVVSTHDDYFKSIDLLKKEMGTENFDQFITLMQKANDILKEVKNQ